MGYDGPAYTWTNRRMAKWHIRERLDRSLANVEWRMLFPQAAVHHLPRIASDHNPIFTTLHKSTIQRRLSFKFESMWIQREDLETLIRDSWNNSPNLTSSYQRKTQVMQSRIRRWRTVKYGNPFHRSKEISTELQLLRSLPPTSDSIRAESELEGQLEELIRSQEEYWRQRAKAH